MEQFAALVLAVCFSVLLILLLKKIFTGKK